MTMHSGVRGGTGIVVAVVCVLAAAVGSLAVAQPAKPTIDVAVLADRYVVAGRAIDDLDVLQATVSPQRPQMVRLAACGEGTTRALLAAAHALRGTYLELRTVEANAPVCRSEGAARALPVAQRAGLPPYGIDDLTVGQWALQTMP